MGALKKVLLVLTSPAAVRTKSNGTNFGFQRAGRSPVTSDAECQTAQREIILISGRQGKGGTVQLLNEAMS